jgi:hypothetical protein
MTKKDLFLLKKRQDMEHIRETPGEQGTSEREIDLWSSKFSP